MADVSAEKADNSGTEFANYESMMEKPTYEQTDSESAGAPEDAAQIQSDLDQLQSELEAARERHLRLAAEFDNYRKRVAREQTESVARAQALLLNKLVDVLDDLERVAHHSESASSEALLHGIELVERKLRQTLETSGLERIEADDEVFDPATMEAVATVPAESPDEDDHVADVFQAGYRYQGVLLRPARVRVKKYEA
jgi:molecular chaperone GrpE